jgi:RNA methyltransferase, TrmH family
VEAITSLKNEHIQTAKSLSSLKGRKLLNKILLEGEEILLWAIKYNVKIDFIITSLDNIKNITDILKYPVQAFKTTEGLMKKITDTRYLIPVIGVGKSEVINKVNDFILVLDNVKDFGNIGTIIRTANAFGIKKVVSTNNDFDLFQKKTIESSRGAVFNTECTCLQGTRDTIKYLRDNDYQIVTASPYGSELQSLVSLAGRPIALIIGNETYGASKELLDNSDVIIQIPMQENIESLNVGVATGISIYELRLKQVIKMIENRIKSTLGRELNVASMLSREALDGAIQKVSILSSHQLVFLMVLKCDEKMARSEIQKQFGILDSEFNKFIELLITNKLITQFSDDNYSITEKGIEIIGKLWAIVENTENAILADFSEDEKAKLFDLLKRIKDNCVNLMLTNPECTTSQ